MISCQYRCTPTIQFPTRYQAARRPQNSISHSKAQLHVALPLRRETHQKEDEHLSNHRFIQLPSRQGTRPPVKPSDGVGKQVSTQSSYCRRKYTADDGEQAFPDRRRIAEIPQPIYLLYELTSSQHSCDGDRATWQLTKLMFARMVTAIRGMVLRKYRTPMAILPPIACDLRVFASSSRFFQI